MGKVCEAFGAAWSAVGLQKEAIERYSRALKTEDGGASLSALEQLGYCEVRLNCRFIRRSAKDVSENLSQPLKLHLPNCIPVSELERCGRRF